MQVETRHVLVFAPEAESFAEFCNSVRRQPWIEGEVEGCRCRWCGDELCLEIDMVEKLEDAAIALHSGYYNLVLVDCRHVPGFGLDWRNQERKLLDFLEMINNERDVERRYPLRRVIVLVGDVDHDREDRLIFKMGSARVGACLRDTSISCCGDPDEARAEFIETLWKEARKILVGQRRGKKAISAAGGGITGIFYELGVLKCLHDAMDSDIRDFDLYLGISGGAVVSSCLANGISIDEMIRKIGDLDHSWRYRLQLSWKQLNLLEVPKRMMLLQKETIRYFRRMLKREDQFNMASVFGLYAILLGPIFDNAPFEKAIRSLFIGEGRTNDFRGLGPELFIGATDQDTREHVLFGEMGLDDIPISRAVQASAAMHPFFPAVEIHGRLFTDGIVTRTSNLRAAVNHGADLVFVIDPFVPLITEEAGFNARHGNMWIVEQDYKTMSYTRFSQAREELSRVNPFVNIYTFVPSNRMRRLMAKQNPFVSRNFNQIVCEAYRSTYRRLKKLEYKMTGELAAHNITMNLERAAAKVEELRKAKGADVRILIEESDDSSRVA